MQTQNSSGLQEGINMADKDKLDNLEEEVRREEGIDDVGPDMTTHEAGKLGGEMVKRLIKEGEENENGKNTENK